MILIGKLLILFGYKRLFLINSKRCNIFQIKLIFCQESTSKSESDESGEAVVVGCEPPPKETKLGRPEIYSLEDRTNLGICIHFQVSSNKSGKMLKHFDVIQAPANRSTVDRASVENYLAILYHCSSTMAVSTDLWFSVDGSGAKRGRDFTNVNFGGVDVDGDSWVQTIEFHEHSGVFGAEAEAKLLFNCLQRINKIQDKIGVNCTKLWDFKSCVYDNASVNTGSISGVGARVEEERQKRWKAAGYTNPLTKMVTVGCSDHMVDLVSKSITLKITKDTKLDVNGFLKRLAKYCEANRPAMDEFWRRALQLSPETKKDLEMIKHDKSRFISMDVIARLAYEQWDLFFLFYVESWPILTKPQRKDFELMCDPLLFDLVKMRAQMSDSLLSSVMKDMKELKSAMALKQYLEEKCATVTAGLVDPLAFFEKHSYSRPLR